MRQSRARSAYMRWIGLLIMAVVAALLPPGTAAGTAGGPELTVMTRNLYLGTGLDNTVTATTPGALVAAATQDWLNVVANDFPTRARALADEIAQARPDVLALQEVSLWRDQTPSDIVSGTITPNAGHVVYDFLAILRADLAARHVPYVAESISTNADAEAPRLDPSSANGVTDVRLTDRDALLVRAPLAGKITDPHNGHYAAQFTVPTFRGPVSFTRGWTLMDYRQDARTRSGSSRPTSRSRVRPRPLRCRSPRATRPSRSSLEVPTPPSSWETSTPRPTARRRPPMPT